MDFNIIGARTSRSDIKDLCRSCSKSHIYTDGRGEHKICDANCQILKIQGLVSDCDCYTEVGRGKYDFEKIAWIIETKNGKIAGFRPPKPED